MPTSIIISIIIVINIILSSEDFLNYYFCFLYYLKVMKINVVTTQPGNNTLFLAGWQSSCWKVQVFSAISEKHWDIRHEMGLLPHGHQSLELCDSDHSNYMISERVRAQLLHERFCLKHMNSQSSQVTGPDSLSSILAWRIPWTEEAGRLSSTRLHRVGHDWRDFARTHYLHHNF